MIKLEGSKDVVVKTLNLMGYNCNFNVVDLETEEACKLLKDLLNVESVFIVPNGLDLIDALAKHEGGLNKLPKELVEKGLNLKPAITIFNASMKIDDIGVFVSSYYHNFKLVSITDEDLKLLIMFHELKHIIDIHLYTLEKYIEHKDSWIKKSYESFGKEIACTLDKIDYKCNHDLIGLECDGFAVRCLLLAKLEGLA